MFCRMLFGLPLSHEWQEWAMLKCVALALLVMVSSGSAFALAPHEVVVLINDVSPASVEVGELYVKLRGVPRQNVVHLDILPSDLAGGWSISPARFRKLIWRPVTKALARRKLNGHVLAWVYSVGFPTGVSTVPPVSIQGMTFLRGEEPYEHVRSWIDERLVRSQHVCEEFHALCVRAGYPPG